MTPRVYCADAALCWRYDNGCATLSCGDLVMIRAYRHRGGWRLNFNGQYRSLVDICGKYNLPPIVQFQADMLDDDVKEAP